MTSFLQDLEMAGVRWELDEVAFGVVRQDVESGAISAPKARVATSVVPPISPIVQVSPETAKAVASRPVNMDSLLRVIAEFNHPLRTSVTNVVLPHVASNPNGVLVITDIPSSEDDETGKILTGASGELLDKMLSAIGMSRETEIGRAHV